MIRIRIVFVADAGAAFCQALYKVLMRKSEAEKNRQRVDFSNPFRLFLCSISATLWRSHQDHDQMRVGKLTSEAKIKK
jgi:hypothetical protein